MKRGTKPTSGFSLVVVLLSILLVFSGCLTPRPAIEAQHGIASNDEVDEVQGTAPATADSPQDSWTVRLVESQSWALRFETPSIPTEIRVNNVEMAFTYVDTILTIPYLMANATYEIEFIDGGQVQAVDHARTPPFPHQVSEVATISTGPTARPGTNAFTLNPERLGCTLNFLLSDRVGSLYFLSAGHCYERGDHVGVRNESDRSLEPIGEVVVTSPLVGGGAGLPNYFDVALIKIYEESYGNILPTMVGDRGPSRPPRDAHSGEEICLYGHGGRYNLIDRAVIQVTGNISSPAQDPETRYRCGEIGGERLPPYDTARQNGQYQSSIHTDAGDSGAPDILLDGAPLGYAAKGFSNSLPSEGASGSISICKTLELLWDLGYELGIVLGNSVPERSPFYFPSVETNPTAVDCDEEAPYMTVPYRSWEIREGLIGT